MTKKLSIAKQVRAYTASNPDHPFADDFGEAIAAHIEALESAIRAKLKAEAAFRAAAKSGVPFDGLAAADDAATARLRELVGDDDD